MAHELPRKMAAAQKRLEADHSAPAPAVPQEAASDRACQGRADLLALVSHDMRSPLTAIIGYADLLAMGVPEPLTGANREHVQRIRVSAEHLLCLVNQLLSSDPEASTASAV
jgi:signal transduction histidine kinase